MRRVTVTLGELLYLNIFNHRMEIYISIDLYDCSNVILDFIAMCSYLYSGFFPINLVGDDQACLGENVTADDLFVPDSAWQPV